LTTLRTYIKRVRKAIDAKNSAEASTALSLAVRVIDKAAQKGVIDRKSASRKISRLTKSVARTA
jgi:small subunit ribosomal protein S20